MDSQFERPDPVEPFHSEPAQLSGCGKPAVIGCLVVMLLVGLGLGVLIWKARDLFAFAIGEYRAAVMAALPEDLADGERQRLELAFDRALEAIEAGEINPAGLQKLQRAVSAPPRPGEVLERRQVLELIEALEEIAGASGADRSRLPGPPQSSSPPLVAAAGVPAG